MSAPRPPLSRQQAERMAHQAFDAYAALQRAEKREPELGDNPFWQPLKDTAYARFRLLYDKGAAK